MFLVCGRFLLNNPGRQAGRQGEARAITFHVGSDSSPHSFPDMGQGGSLQPSSARPEQNADLGASRRAVMAKLPPVAAGMLGPRPARRTACATAAMAASLRCASGGTTLAEPAWAGLSRDGCPSGSTSRGTGGIQPDRIAGGRRLRLVGWCRRQPS